MGLVNIPKIKDYRMKLTTHKTKKYVGRRKGVTSIRDIAIHHSATLQKLAGSSAAGYARYHVNSLGWPGIGYSYVIEADGTVKYVNDLAKKTYHVGNHNDYAVGIVLSGDFSQEEPTKAQVASLRQLVRALREKYPHIKQVKGHSDYAGYHSKACPVFDYKQVLAGAESSGEGLAYVPPKLVVDGYLGPLTIKALQGYFGTTVDGYLSRPSPVIKAMQGALGTVVDGYISEPYSPMVAALQARLGTPVDGKISKPSLVIKALQRGLNSGRDDVFG